MTNADRHIPEDESDDLGGASDERDAPLSKITPAFETYFNSTTNKGALAWRIVATAVGRDAFASVLRGQLSSSKALSLASDRRSFFDHFAGFSLSALRAKEIEVLQPSFGAERQYATIVDVGARQVQRFEFCKVSQWRQAARRHAGIRKVDMPKIRKAGKDLDPIVRYFGACELGVND